VGFFEYYYGTHEKMKISIAIACYEYGGKGVEVLEHSFVQMSKQIFTDYEVVISDHSVDREIEYLCDKWIAILDIKYFRNEEKRGYPALNKNNSLSKCKGELIKILDQDDYLYDENSLQMIVDNFDKDTNWLATGYMHTRDRINYERYHLPTWNDHIYVNNTIGTPSCITIRNKDLPEFDESLIIAYDCDFYKKMFDKFGPPKIIDAVGMINYLWPNQISSRPEAQSIIDREFSYLRNKYG
jgi:glycosyltransferase involved in cell wall biosynthesis